jgi:Protein of unknown function (DUF1638)
MSTAVLACGALAADVRRISRRRGWRVDVHPLPALLHNRPAEIAPALAAELDRLGGRYERVAVAYADCGSYGAIDTALAGTAVDRLSGEHCYEVLGRDEVARALADEPGTYFLTDFLARTFEHTVIRELGLDRHPELRDDYFGHYTRVVWLAQRPTPATRAAGDGRGRDGGARAPARTVDRVGLPRGPARSLPSRRDPLQRGEQRCDGRRAKRSPDEPLRQNSLASRGGDQAPLSELALRRPR